VSPKYPNPRKRVGYWKRYERADIKNYRKVWNATYQLVCEGVVPFEFSRKGRKPNLEKEEYVCMAVLHVYFDNDFRETEQQITLLTSKKLDHTNCVRWFGKINPKYVDNLVFRVHKKLIGIDDVGDYIVDSTQVTCDRYEVKEVVDKEELHLQTLKLHILVTYLLNLGLVSIISTFASPGKANDSPFLRKKLLKKEKIIHGRTLHADKGYFGKENIKTCKQKGLKPNIVPKEMEYSDTYLKKYAEKEYDNKARKATRGLVETPFGGLETETGMKIRCRKPHHRNIYICLMALKHNIRSYLRATALKLELNFAPTSINRKLFYTLNY